MGICASREKDSEYYLKLDEARASGGKFEDPKFPAAKESLIKDWASSDPEIQGLVETWEKYQWIRASEIKSLNDDEGQLQVFAGKIEPNDIAQGALGDCYLLSVMSALTENPDRVRRIFETETITPEGIYALNVTKNGVKMQVVLDDHIPCTEDGEPCFSKANGNELWVLLLEKCWAKLHGSYAHIIGGQSHLTFRDLTGAPSFEQETSGENAWQEISEADQKNYILCAGISAGDDDQKAKMEELGLVAQHSYGLIAVLEANDADGNPLQLVKLRNPWGKFEWTGDWGDSSELWTDELKQKAGLTAEDDGCFWMSFNDFKEYFSRYQICKYRDHFKFNSEKLSATQEGLYFKEVYVSSSGPHTFAVSQVDERCLPPREGFSYSSCKITILDSSKKIVGACKGYCERDAYVEIENLNSGNYTMIVDMEWDEHQVFDCEDPLAFIAINCYGKGDVTFGPTVSPESQGVQNNDQLLHHFMEQGVSQLVKGELPEHVEKLEMGEDKKVPLVVRYECSSAPNGYNWILIINGENNATFNEQSEYSAFDGLCFVEPPPESFSKLPGENVKEAQSYDINVPPMKQAFILIRTKAAGFGMGCSISRKVLFDDATLLQMVQDQEEGKQFRSEEHNISVKELSHDYGVVFLYENGSADQVLKEELELELKDMDYKGDFKLLDESVPKICMKVKPGESKILRFNSTSNEYSYSYSMGTMIIPQDQDESD